MISNKNAVSHRIFLGRIEEQKRFKSVLEAFLSTGSKEEYPHVVLISGGAGMGKTSLKRRFQDIVQSEAPFTNRFKVLTIDWADERKKNPGLQVARDHIEAALVFRAIHNEAIRRKWGRQFAAYNRAIKQAHEVDKQVAEVLAASTHEDEVAILRRAGVPAIARIVRWRAPFIGEAGEQIVESLLGVGIQVASEQLTSLNNRLKIYLQANLKPNHFDYFLNPNEQLAHQLARGLTNVAKSKRLIIFLDSYEIVDRNDIWLRSVIREAGPRVMWVICGRNDLVRSRQFGDEFFKGYADDWSRHLTQFGMWPLSVNDISEYFEMQGRPLDKEEVNSLSMVTRGRPLAVHEAAAVISAGESLEEVLNDMMKVSGNDQIMRSMTESYLKHAVADDDRKSIYALVLARGDVDTLRTMLQPAGEKRFNLEKLLQRLERDYSTVTADHARLHDEHAEFIHEYLKNQIHRTSSMVQDLIEKAIKALREKLIKIEIDLDLFEECCREDNWVQAVVSLTQYLLWKDEREAFLFALPRFVEGMAYNQKLCQALLRSWREWYDQLSPGGREIFNGLSVLDNKFVSTDEEAHLLETLKRMEERGWLNGEAEAAGRRERQAIGHLLNGKLSFKQKQYDLARQDFVKVEDGLPEGGIQLRSQLAEALSHMAQVLSFTDGREARYNAESETLLEKANELLPDEHWTWFELGLMRHLGDKPADALHAFEQAADLNAKHEATHLHIGDALLALGRHDEAIEAFDKAGKMKTGFAAPRIGLGDVHLAMGNLSEAEKFYKRALKIDGKALDAWQKLGDLYSKQGKLEEAHAAFQNAGTIQPLSGTADVGRAKILYGRGDLDGAELALEAALAKGEEASELYLLQGYISRDRGDLNGAVDSWKQAAELAPDLAEPVDLLGQVYEELGRTDEAIALYRAAVNRQGDFSEGWNHLAEALQKVGRHKESSEIYANLEVFEPEAETLYRRAQSSVAGRNYLDALDAFSKLTDAFPEYAPGWSGLGQTHMNLTQPDLARNAYERAIALDPTQPGPYIGLGWVELRNQQVKMAEQHFRQALAGDEDSIEAQCGLAEVKMAQYRYDDAEGIFSRIWRESPNTLDALIGLGRVAVKNQSFTEAADIWQQALEMNQSHPAIHTGRGEVFQQQNRPGVAVRAFERAIQVDPLYAPAYRAMGDTLHSLGKMDSALASYRKAVGIDETLKISPVNLGDVLTSLGRYGEALAAYQKALNPDQGEREQDSGALYIGLGNVYTALGRLDEARDAYDMALRLDHFAVNAFLGLGRIHTILRNFHEGRMAFKDALAIRAGGAEANQGLGEINRLEGKHAAATTAYRNAIASDKKFAPAYLGIAQVYFAQQNLDAAKKSARTALHFGQKMPTACDLLGEIALQQGQHLDAERYYQQSIGMDDSRAQAFGGMGTTLLALGRRVKAKDYFEAGLEKEDVDENYPYIRLGKLYHEQNLFNKAEEVYKMAERIGCSDPLVPVAYGDLQQELDNQPRALELYRVGIDLSKKNGEHNAEGWRGVGQVQLKQQEWADAIGSFEEAMGNGLRDAGILVDIADAYRGQKSHDNARRYYEKALLSEPENMRAYLGIGLTFRAEGNHEEALKYLGKASRLENKESSSSQIAIPMGYELLHSNQLSEARLTFNRLIENEPKEVEAYIGIAEVGMAENDLEMSLAGWKSALRLQPDNPKVLKGMGEVLVRQGKPLQALEMFRETVRIDPRWRDAQRRLGDILVQREFYDEAFDAYQGAVECNQADVGGWIGLGQVSRRLGHFDEAGQYLRQALVLASDHLVALSELVQMYVGGERWDDALDMLQRLVRLEPQTAGHHIEMGRVMQQLGRLKEALSAYGRGLKTDRSSASGWVGLGDVFDYLGHTEPARQAFKAALALEKVDGEDRAAALSGLARIQQAEGQLKKAADVYVEALSHHEWFAPAHIGLGEVYAKQGDGASAQGAFERAIEIVPNHPRALTGLGEVVRKGGDSKRAVELFNRAINVDPTWVPALTGLGRIWFDEGRVDHAHEVYHKAHALLAHLAERPNLKPEERMVLKTTEQRVLVQIGLGNVALAEDKLGKAAQIFRQAIEVSPNYARAFTGLGFTLERLNRPEEALTAFHTALEVDPDESAAFAGLGDIAHSRGQSDRATELYEQAFMLRPNDERIMLRLGRMYAKRADSSPAIPILEKLSRKPRGTASQKTVTHANRLLGDLYTDRRQYDSAVMAYQKSLDSDGGEVRALAGLGWARLRQGEWVQAVQTFEQAVELSKKDPQLLNGLGRAYTKIDQPDRAVPFFNQALLLDEKAPGTKTDRASIFTGRGLALIASNDSNAAMRDLDQARSLDGKYGEAEMARGHLLVREERFNEAIAAYERGVLFNWKTAELYLNLGQTFLYTNRAERAKNAFSNAIERDGNHAGAHAALGDVYREEGEFERAMESYRRAIKLDSGLAAGYGGLADVFHEMRETDKAIALYHRTVELNPTDGISYGRLAGLYRKQGDQDKYERAYETAQQLVPSTSYYNQACLESIRGNVTGAVQLLRRGLHLREIRPEWVRRDPDFDFIREDPRFVGLLSGW